MGAQEGGRPRRRGGIHGVLNPFVALAFFASRPFVAAVIVGFFSMLANLSIFVFVPLLLIEENGLSPAAGGLVLTPGAVALAVLSPLAGRLSDRVGVRPPLVAGLVIMGLSVLFVSTFAGGSSVLIAAGILGVGAGFAFVQSPANAAANALPGEEVGAGMGIFAGAFFLGSGTGPALVGALLTAGEESGAGAINPLYALDAAPFSDAFLAVSPPSLVIALVAAFASRGGTEGNEQSDLARRPRRKAAGADSGRIEHVKSDVRPRNPTKPTKDDARIRRDLRDETR